MVEFGRDLLLSGATEEDRMPNRVQLQRVKGWRMPANTRKVDRPTVFGNPFDSVKHDTSDAVRSHRLWLTGVLTNEHLLAQYPDIVAKHLIARRRRVLESLAQLRGLNLACWCPPARPCHADLLLKLANGAEAPRRHLGANPNRVQSLTAAGD